MLSSENDMEIETERLFLRRMTDDDRLSLASVISDPENMRFYDAPYDEAGVQRWLEWNKENYCSFGFGLWAVCLKETGEMIGDCGITMQKINGWIKPEIGYHIRLDQHRKGYAKETCKAVRDWAFENTPFNELFSYLNAANEASARTAASNGMTFRLSYKDENGEELQVFSITKDEWKRLKRE